MIDFKELDEIDELISKYGQPTPYFKAQIFGQIVTADGRVWSDAALVVKYESLPSAPFHKFLVALRFLDELVSSQADIIRAKDNEIKMLNGQIVDSFLATQGNNE